MKLSVLFVPTCQSDAHMGAAVNHCHLASVVQRDCFLADRLVQLTPDQQQSVSHLRRRPVFYTVSRGLPSCVLCLIRGAENAFTVTSSTSFNLTISMGWKYMSCAAAFTTRTNRDLEISEAYCSYCYLFQYPFVANKFQGTSLRSGGQDHVAYKPDAVTVLRRTSLFCARCSPRI
ncbi:hypothetical protein IF1G_08252 [Cordyceps javanica]|uniref:Uncharacterized protein n=1 Tax=Cordyceps javanica TaxID=43265 RepID=A0A545UU19_9HYPO|nr:hypothetical protein IF1G_08252 [Cordyceps javanica]